MPFQFTHKSLSFASTALLPAAFWQAFVKSVGSTGSGARKLEVAVFGAMTSVAVLGLLSVDKLWDYKNKGAVADV